MTSFPQYRLERYIDTFDKLRKAKIFPPDDLKTILMKIRDHEYKIERSSVTKYEYLKYVQYLQVLLQLIGKRRSLFNNPLQYKEIEVKLNGQMKKLLWKAVQRDKSDIKLWFDYIDFCRHASRAEDVSKLFVAMLQIHPDKEDVWIASAKYHFEVMRTPNIARNLLQTGIRDNPESINLWKEYFRFELLHSDMVRKRSEILRRELDDEVYQNTSTVTCDPDANDAVLSGKVALVVFKNAIPLLSKNFTQTDLFLQIVNEFEPPLRTNVKREMLRMVEENFPDREEVFDFKAECMVDKDFASQHTNSDLDSFELVSKGIDLATSVYREGIKQLPTIKMWNLFISFHLKLLETARENEEAREKQLDQLLLLFDECWRSDLMSRHAFLEWILLLEMKDQFDTIDKLMAKGCQKWSKHADIWYLRLSVMAKKISFKEELKRLFIRAMKEIEFKSEDEEAQEDDLSGLKVKNMERKTIEDVWIFYIGWSSKYLNPSEVIKFIEKRFLELLQQSDNLLIQRKLSALLKTQLLRKSIELKSNGLKLARSYYTKYKNHPPLFKEFFQEMINIEKNQHPMDRGQIVNVYEDLIHNFGEDDHQIWLDYCKFIMDGDKPQNVCSIHHRACKTLNPFEISDFLSAYSLMQNGKL